MFMGMLIVHKNIYSNGVHMLSHSTTPLGKMQMQSQQCNYVGNLSHIDSIKVFVKLPDNETNLM